ncbi:glycoside hydrolase family 97 protein [Christiangramia aestuarii]|uniref:Glycoside hydrolase family 97 protein n=1 Tax=Christiangramia aestuarii TaxID=1028746 RepID=A0A7K1LRL6_9FLAO|nr:glycoside hydrolase family 97 protein [Christiangramia aestuarii]MUP43433.1 glycoside hydrolase family 97 protein [Christiangramia aestuarii]
MKKFSLLACMFFCFHLIAQQQVSSPNGEIKINFDLDESGKAFYEVSFQGKKVLDRSYLGFDLQDAEALDDNFEIADTQKSSFDETWPMPWGEQLEVRNHYNELMVELKEKSSPGRSLKIVFRAYDDGIGFRYEFPEQENLEEVIIADENTEFALTGDHKAFWIPGDWDIYEHLYNTTRVSEIDATTKRNNPNLGKHTFIPENAVNTPVTMKADEGYHLSFHEAQLIDYAGMTLKVDPESLKLTSELVGSDITGYKVKRQLPFHTPWRMVIITEKATELIDSKLVLNLNEPNKLGDISWFKPTKYSGIWWEMHLGKSTWDMTGNQDMNTYTKNAKPHGRHGATTENAKALIDFSAKNGIGAMLVEGWNTGWEHWIGFEDREGVFDFVTPYDDYDLDEVVEYGKSKGVDIVMHHETSAAPRTYEKQLDTAYKLMQKYGMHVVKSGYVGKIIPKGEYHHGQWMVNHYNDVAIKGADYQVTVNAHEPIKATGLRRTYPNIIAREGLRGQEFNAWASDGGNPPEHLPIVAFTRMLAGPIDFTQGIFNIKFDEYKPENQVNTTLAHQLALYIVIYSPVQMVPDLPEHYEGKPEFQFIRDVAVDWQQTEVLNGEVGDFVTIARKDRNSENWFLGSVSDENARQMQISLDFLDEGATYTATIYEDAEDAHWDKNPTATNIRKVEVDSGDSIELKLAPGGGAAISLMKK